MCQYSLSNWQKTNVLVDQENGDVLSLLREVLESLLDL
jgi:hypothetical protein